MSVDLSLNDRVAGIVATLDDLQSGIEASLRATDTLHSDTEKFDRLLSAPLREAVVQHLQELQACGRDQREALRELRDGVARLQEDLARSIDAERPPPLTFADYQRW